MKREISQVELSEPEFVHIMFDQLDTSLGLSHMWFRIENLPWMIERWTACTEPYCERVHEDRIDDSFTVKQIGREGAWRLLMQNRRAEGTPHAGVYSFSTTLTSGEELLRKLRELAKAQGL